MNYYQGDRKDRPGNNSQALMFNPNIVDISIFLHYTGFDAQIALITAKKAYEEKRVLYLCGRIMFCER